jgi:F1F0 ATPase subunit 2
MIDLDLPTLAVAFAAGAVAGAIYLALLWRSVGRLADARRPVVALLSGMAFRLSLLLGAFYLLMDGDPLRLVAALAGFLAVRIVVTRIVGRPRPATHPATGPAGG